MCGRYAHLLSWEELHTISSLNVPEISLPKRYNIAPTQLAPVIRAYTSGTHRLDLLRWGIIPSWVKDLKKLAPLINARAETVSEKPSFRSAFQARRCLVPVSGFYEWKAVAGQKTKQPYYITSKGGSPLFFAGIWEEWRSEKEETVTSFSVITTKANDLMATIHERMPVILTQPAFETWLNPKGVASELKYLLVPLASESLQMHPVSSMVNFVKNDSPECISAVG